MSSFLFCTQCEENHDNSFGGHCPVCGNRLISGSRSETSSASIPSRQHTFTARMDIPGLEDVEFLEGMLDVLGIQFGDALIQRLRGIQPETPISNEYIKSIGRITLDRNLSILPDITLNIGQYKAMLVPASFGSQVIVGNSISSKIVWATPEFGDSAISNNVDVCGSIVLFKRGKVPFIDKALKAVASGAIAVLICQSFDTWPFAITDSTVVDSSEIPIPIFMISKQDAALVDAMLHNKKGGDVIASINRRDTETLCSICHDSMKEGDIILKLPPCRHCYHEECVISWLTAHNTCPLCRNTMPVEDKKQSATSTASTNLDVSASQQPYFL